MPRLTWLPPEAVVYQSLWVGQIAAGTSGRLFGISLVKIQLCSDVVSQALWSPSLYLDSFCWKNPACVMGRAVPWRALPMVLTSTFCWHFLCTGPCLQFLCYFCRSNLREFLRLPACWSYKQTAEYQNATHGVDSHILTK